jgi:hypothetical protein
MVKNLPGVILPCHAVYQTQSKARYGLPSAKFWPSKVDALEPNDGRPGIDGHDEFLPAFEEQEELLGIGTPVIADRQGIDACPLEVTQQLARALGLFRAHNSIDYRNHGHLDPFPGVITFAGHPPLTEHVGILVGARRIENERYLARTFVARRRILKNLFQRLNLMRAPIMSAL